MQDEGSAACPHRELVEAFAQDKLGDAQRREAERVLEESEPCREYFRQLTAGRYPRLPNYTIIGQVGKGGFGVVYKAVHHAKERTEALKVLFSKTPLLTSYFENEVHLIARLRQPNIAVLYDAQLSTPPLYYTMEFVEGERLNDYVKRHEASLAERIAIIKTVAQAVDYAHGQGVVHRDLKPQNVLIDREGQPHIVDFGIAKKLALAGAWPPGAEGAAPDTHEGPVGTLGYIAPEQEKGGPVDARADIFALGALLFHCVTGEPARLAKVPDQRIRILRERQVAQPEDLAAIVARCVEDSPERRYATCADLVADLSNYVAGRPIRAHEGASWGYQTARIAALVIRDSPVTVRSAVLILVAGVLTWLFWTMETEFAGAGRSGNQTVMIGFTDETLRAIEEGRLGADLPDLSIYVTESWRMLYGRLLERLAEAEPLVVAVDSHLDQCSEYDEYFLRGLRALHAPVIVAVRRFDSDGVPEMCATIRDAVDGYAMAIGTDPGKHPNKYEVVYCVQPRFQSPIPGLALAAYAATRHPDCEFQLELAVDERRLHLRYRQRGQEQSASMPASRTEDLSLHSVETAREGGGALRDLVGGGFLEKDDKVAHALVRANPNAYWASEGRSITFEQVLNADTPQLKAWFKGRAIVVGQMCGTSDRYVRANKEIIYGCQVHAEALRELLAGVGHHRFFRAELATRNVFWCAVAVLLVSVIRPKRWPSPRRVGLICPLLSLVGLVVGAGVAMQIDEPWLVEVLIAATGLLAAGSLAFWTRAVRERQLERAPSAITLTSEGPTLESTILAETR